MVSAHGLADFVNLLAVKLLDFGDLLQVVVEVTQKCLHLRFPYCQFVIEFVPYVLVFVLHLGKNVVCTGFEHCHVPREILLNPYQSSFELPLVLLVAVFVRNGPQTVVKHEVLRLTQMQVLIEGNLHLMPNLQVSLLRCLKRIL